MSKSKYIKNIPLNSKTVAILILYSMAMFGMGRMSSCNRNKEIEKVRTTMQVAATNSGQKTR
ncbi:hypothetical protein HDR66_02990 [bacterium]|nr:hypothetical protein [bacterium]